MILQTLTLENFRNHTQSSFSFDTTTVIIGKNTKGKTNILEAIHFLSSGKSFRAEKDIDTIKTETDFATINGIVKEENDPKELRIILARKNGLQSKKFLVNNTPKRQSDFVEHFYSVLFTPQDIEIISLSPSLRRKYIDSILYKAHKKYRHAVTLYEKSLRHRNRMLSDIKDGRKFYKPIDFEYWDNLLIENGEIITEFRESLLEYVNSQEKDIFNFQMFYDKSTVTRERLEKYYDAERASGITLVGPQRDEFVFLFPHKPHPNPLLLGEGNQSLEKSIKEFGSRGEQRLTILQMKVLEIHYIKEATENLPVLLLDDIFSELDDENIEKVFHLISSQQTIITTTHREFVPEDILKRKDLTLIEL